MDARAEIFLMHMRCNWCLGKPTTYHVCYSPDSSLIYNVYLDQPMALLPDIMASMMALFSNKKDFGNQEKPSTVYDNCHLLLNLGSRISYSKDNLFLL